MKYKIVSSLDENDMEKHIVLKRYSNIRQKDIAYLILGLPLLFLMLITGCFSPFYWHEIGEYTNFANAQNRLLCEIKNEMDAKYIKPYRLRKVVKNEIKI